MRFTMISQLRYPRLSHFVPVFAYDLNNFTGKILSINHPSSQSQFLLPLYPCFFISRLGLVSDRMHALWQTTFLPHVSVESSEKPMKSPREPPTAATSLAKSYMSASSVFSVVVES